MKIYVSQLFIRRAHKTEGGRRKKSLVESPEIFHHYESVLRPLRLFPLKRRSTRSGTSTGGGGSGVGKKRRFIVSISPALKLFQDTSNINHKRRKNTRKFFY
jgi:hypothetical protein